MPSLSVWILTITYLIFIVGLGYLLLRGEKGPIEMVNQDSPAEQGNSKQTTNTAYQLCADCKTELQRNEIKYGLCFFCLEKQEQSPGEKFQI